MHDRDDPNALMISIIDLQGINLSILRKPELLNFVKTFVAMIDAHYPTRAYKTYMINAPQWFSTLYKAISPILRETTKEKIVLYSAGDKQDQALREALGEEMANLVQQALRMVPTKGKKKSKKKDPSDLSLTSDILLNTTMEQTIRKFVSIDYCYCSLLLVFGFMFGLLFMPYLILYPILFKYTQVVDQLDGETMKPIQAPPSSSRTS